MQSQTQLFESIFKREINNGSTISFLEDAAAQYPYFTPAHFFLLRQKGIADDQEAGKAALLFNNPHWLSYQLDLGKEKEIFSGGSLASIATNNVEEVTLDREINIEPFVTVAYTDTNIVKEPATEEDIYSGNNMAEDKATEIGYDKELNDQPFVTEADNTEPIIEQQESVVNIAEEVMVKSEPDLTPLVDEAEPVQEEAIEASTSSENDNNTNETFEGSKITGIVEEMKTRKDVAPNEMMLFEPMHMVDYFASQGIKLSEEIQTGDKLGKQLRSFTEWLKTMKKIHADKLPESSQQTDITVQALAEKSNAEDEVVTESMAEVFAMQGKLSKAKAVYQKLSLLDPAKSAFFAAKIEQLKG